MTSDSCCSFFADLDLGDSGRLQRYLAPEAMYQNLPLPPAHGRDAALQKLAALVGVMPIDGIETLQCLQGCVLAERVELFPALSTGKISAVPITGVTRVVDSLIVELRDHFDLRDFEGAVDLPLRA